MRKPDHRYKRFVVIVQKKHNTDVKTRENRDAERRWTSASKTLMLSNALHSDKWHAGRHSETVALNDDHRLKWKTIMPL